MVRIQTIVTIIDNYIEKATCQKQLYIATKQALMFVTRIAKYYKIISCTMDQSSKFLEHLFCLWLYLLITETHTITRCIQKLSQLNALNVKNAYEVLIQNNVCKDLFFRCFQR